MPLAIVVALLMGLMVGILNGWLIARFRLQPFIVTLATMGSLRGLLYMYSATPQYNEDPLFRSLLGGGSVGPFPVASLLLLAALPVVWFYLNRTTSGRAVYAIGVNAEAVRLAGIDVRRHLIAAYAASGFLAALAGVLLASRLGIAQPSVGVGYELDAIAAVVIGGGILGGGGGTVAGVFGGVLALAVVDNVLNLFNVESYYQQFVKGVIILIAVLARRKAA
jgi:ribose/xylose/arabinose/galactoside ABC-type transport system permease subunit